MEDDQGKAEATEGRQLEELSAYHDKVVQELRRREHLLGELKGQIASVEMQLRGLSVAKGLREGSAMKVAATEAYRATLRKQLDKLRKEAATIEEDVLKARDRKADVEQEMQALLDERRA